MTDLKQLKQEMEKEFDKEFLVEEGQSLRSDILFKPEVRGKIQTLFPIFCAKYMQKVADMYEKRKYWCTTCKGFMAIREDDDICCVDCGLIITTYEQT